MLRLRDLGATAGLVVALAASGCGNGPPAGTGGGSTGGSVGTAAATMPGTPAETIDANGSLKFSPSDTSAKVGQVIHFVNTASGVPHNVTFDDPATALSSQTLQANDTWDVKFTSAGKYTFACTFHPGMNGSITVS